MRIRKHKYFKCKCYRTGCMFCDGGLCKCVVCNGFEGQLLTSCPGYRLSEDTLDACYNGNVKDFCQLKMMKAEGYDIRRKLWNK